MNEQVLQAIIKLLIASIKLDGIAEGERNSFEHFLKENVKGQSLKQYMGEFDKLIETMPANIELTIETCRQINQELSRKQKIIVLLRLVELGYADGELTLKEEALYRRITKEFFIEDHILEAIKNFVITPNIYDLSSFRVLIIDDNPHPEEPHFKHFRKPGLKTPLAILRLPEDEMYFLRLGKMKEPINLNGQIIAPSFIHPLANGSFIRSEHTEPIYYSTIVSYFFQSENKPKISFIAKDIDFFFKSGRQGLHHINIAEEGGNLVALMGASGSGKSTLLSVLNGTKKPQHGSVTINGLDVYTQKEALKGVIGYVPQDDLLIEDLTVYQNLFFAAKLCFSGMSDTEIDKLVMKTLQSLGLTEAKDLKVGNPLEKTISGGQRKRVNIGLELLRQPAVMFVDEPTSGLSSRDSENIMDLLKELTYAGKLIFVVIHQPSSDIFKMFDKLIVLDVGGYQIYYGNPVESVIYFKTLSQHVNPDVSVCDVCGNVNPELIFDIIDSKQVDEYGNVTDQRKYMPSDWRSYYDDNIKLPEIIHTYDQPESSLRIPNRFFQLIIFTIRDFFSKLANRQYMTINLLQAPLLAALLAYIVRYYKVDELTGKGDYVFSENLNIPAYLFMSIIVSLFMGLTISAEEIIKDAKILRREAFLNLSRSSYIFSKMMILFCFSAVQSLLYVLVGNAILGIEGMGMMYWVILFSTSCFANMLGLNISQTFKSVITIYILIPILLIPQLILGGIVVRFDQINPQMYGQDKSPVVGDIMASRWAFEAIMVGQFQYNNYEKDFYKIDRQKAVNEFKALYYIPTLQTKLEYCTSNLSNRDEVFKKNLALIRNELYVESQEIKSIKPPDIQLFTPEKFNIEIAKQTGNYLETLRKIYTRMENKAMQHRDELVQQEMAKDNVAYLKKIKRFQNDMVEIFVTNKNSEERIVEYEGKLVHKIYPVYFSPDAPNHWFAYRTHFFAPEKHIFGFFIPTLYFNVGVIWLMSLVLSFTLYFRVFQRMVEMFG
jgi:ABC-type multidrug transport system ATPase subunit/uncharacterized tellurite resistance protein B-like protein